MTGWSLDAMDIAKFHTLKLSTTVVVYRGKIRKKKINTVINTDHLKYPSVSSE